MFPFDLPTTLDVSGVAYDIRTGYKDILRVLLAFDDPNLTDSEKLELLLENIYIDVESIPRRDLQEAVNAAMRFIDNGQEPGEKSARAMDWEQDAPLLFPAINRAAGFEVRGTNMHWWTFLGYFMEIRDSVFSSVLSLRQKRNRGKPLEKHEKEFWRENRKMCELRTRKSEAQIEEEARLSAMLDGWFGR